MIHRPLGVRDAARRVRWDVVAAAAYVVNWEFAARSIDYLAEDVGPSPVLHFWSLSVDERVYMLWPLLIVIALKLSRAGS